MLNYLVFPLPVILQVLAWVGGGVLWTTLIGAIIGALLPKNAKSIAIFGSKGAGKSTLWKQLKGEFEDKAYHPTLATETIDQFTVECNGMTKTIKKSADFGGDDHLVKRYEEIIEDKTFIYYLIDLTKLKEFKKETRSRLQAISKVLEKHKIDTGLKLVGTHYEEFKNTMGCSRDEAKKLLAESIGLNNIKDIKIDDNIIIAELTDRNDVKQILEQIIA